ncbi:MAG: 3'(2'),5'-bisphosphate nucleotidase CysQ, partial [Actinomycetota bacterium]|nr:3'(2'),5'-bisphosphate nucleotidase CysQ [Actinomycetota bacterium]
MNQLTDARLAAILAGRAGSLLLALRDDPTLGGRELGARGDADSNALLLHELAAARPDDAVLSEESADSPTRLSSSR